MTAKTVATGWQIAMMLPARGRWQQFRLKAADAYTCAGCDIVKTTRFVAVADGDWSAPTCSDCYQLAVAEECLALPSKSSAVAATSMEPPQRIDLQQPKPGFRQLATVVIARAAGTLTSEQDQAFTELAASDAYSAALAFADALLERRGWDGISLADDARAGIRRSLHREQQAIANRRRKQQTKDRRGRGTGNALPVQDPLPALLLSRFRRSAFVAKLTEVMKEEGLTRTRRDMPAETLWDWMVVLDPPSAHRIPADTQELRGLSETSFIEHLAELARRADPSLGALSHPAVLERWAHQAKRVTDGLRKDRRRLEKKVANQQHKAVADLAEADDAYAMGCAMEVIASRLREDLQSQVYLRLQQSEKRAARISRLIEAANRVARNEPRLARPVADACLVHTATCVAAARGDSCAACVPELISQLNAILIAPAPRAPLSGQPKPGTKTATGTPAKPTARPVAPRLAGPGQSATARWLPTGDRIRTGTVRAAWQVALTRDDVNRRRCPIPAGTILPSHETRRLRLYFEHLSAATRPQNVTLRQVGGRWQLEGVRWPTSLQPGLLVDFTWRTDSTTMTAVTKPLRRPERIDGTEFRHEFDRQVVTRELEPDGDPRRATGPVSVERWVLRTLRILGHLCPQGTATLAEDALVRNCQSLGMPDRMTGQVHDATTNLIKAGRIRRVRGGRDSYGGLWYPARSGDNLVDLIRYQPTVEVLKPQSLAKMGAPAPRSAHQVHGFIRRLPAGAHASDRQMELYEEAVQAAELANRSLDPNRFTFVNKHRRAATRGGH